MTTTDKIKMLRLRITLQRVTNPTVWREICIPAAMTFDDLHIAIQCAMGWEDEHLYEFVDSAEWGTTPTKRYAIPNELDCEYDRKTKDSRRYKISHEFTKNGAKLFYVYDFGDHWVHEIEMLSTYTADRAWVYCKAGRGTCPPEDVGGPGGYEKIKEAFAKHDLGEVVLDRMFPTEADDKYINVDFFSKRDTQRCLDAWLRYGYRNF